MTIDLPTVQLIKSLNYCINRPNGDIILSLGGNYTPNSNFMNYYDLYIVKLNSKILIKSMHKRRKLYCTTITNI